MQIGIQGKLRLWIMTSGQARGIGKHTSPPRTTITKNTAILQNKSSPRGDPVTQSVSSRYLYKYHPELSENRAVWKADNQGFKEATFI